MRDPARIGPMLERLRAVWEAEPDLRLAQVVLNAYLDNSSIGYRNIYFVEDDDLMECIERVHTKTPASSRNEAP